MTRLLLDTHALLWTLLEPERIPPAVLAQIRDSRTELLVSAVSAWEIATKHRLGKLNGAGAVLASYHGHLRRLRAGELPISGIHALNAGSLPWEHRDPFDRMIVAQAMVESVPVATADKTLAAFPGVRTVW